MAEIEKTEFEFPHEVEEKQSKAGGKIVEPESDEPEIEVIDDTPEEDRGREPMKTPPEEPTDEELATYSKRDRTKTREFHKAYHDERRAKETALREKEEAIRIAQQVYEENQRLKGTVDSNQNLMLDQVKRTIAQEIDQAKAKYKKAYEDGDSDALVEAQEALTNAKIKADRVNNFKPKPLQAQENVVQTSPSAPKPDERAEDWQRANPWFGPDTEMTGFALAVHNKLINEEGVDPKSDEYYQRLNGRLRQVFPDKFESAEPGDANRRPKSNVVASASRSTAPKKITLTASEVSIAKRLGIPLELYARKVLEIRRSTNG
jgi:hypothetical protein